MLAEARPGLPPERALPGGLAFEQKPDGYRVVLFAGPGRAHLQSRNGADLSSVLFRLCSVACGGTFFKNVQVTGQPNEEWCATGAEASVEHGWRYGVTRRQGSF